MPRRHHRLAATLAAVVLSAGLAACGNDSSDRQDVDQSNEGQLTAPGSPSTVETNPGGLTSTGKDSPTVSQPDTAGP